MGDEDVLVEIVINGREVLQFYSTPEHYKTLYEDRNQLTSTVISAFKDGLLHSPGIKDVSDIQSVKFLSEVEFAAEVLPEEVPQAEEYEAYEVIEDTSAMDNLTSSEVPEELIIDVGLTSDGRLNLCENCDYRTYNVGHFKIHMRQHTGESPFQCNFCDYKSKQKSNLKRHMRQHIEGKDHFECKMCNFTCSQEKIYKRHMILHSRSRPLRPCPFCDYFSTSLAHLTVHIRQHTGETPYHCGTCSYKTVQKSNLTRHLKKHRLGGRVSKADKLRCCSYCSYRTPNPAHLMAHIRAAHTGETPYECTHCSYKSAQRSNLKRHLRKHTGERPFKCNLCSYSTAYPYVLKKHLENHPTLEQKKFTCPDCDYICYSNIDFKRHLKMHMGKTLHCCHICGYVSFNAEHLKAHLRKHSLERPYKCHICSYDSAQKSNLKRHLLFKHSGHAETSNPEDDMLAKVKTEIESPTEVDVIAEDEYYNVETTETVQECDVSELNESADREQAYESESVEYAHESGGVTEEHVMAHEVITETIPENENEHYENENDFDNRQAPENVEIVNEEHVVTTTMETGDYEIIEGYSEETCVTTTVGNVGEGHIRKRKNLSFLNKSQAEKLKEFKRLLQQGTQNSAGVVPNSISKPHAPQAQETGKHNSSGGEFDNISERTESCTEEQVQEEDVHESHIVPVSEVTVVESERVNHEVPQIIEVQQKPSQSVEIHSTERSEQRIQQILQDNSSILIVEHTGGMVLNQEGNEEFHDVVYEYEGFVPYKCELCGYDATTVEDLKAHIGTHTGETFTTTYHCDECNFRTLRKQDISRHKTIFHGAVPEKTLSFICSTCGFRTDNKYEFEVHNETHKKRNLKCEVCGLKMATISEFLKHKKKHVGEEPFECYYCAYLTAKKSHLKYHMKKHPIETSPHHECYTCGFETYDRTLFREHTSSHKVEQWTAPFTCHICRFVTLDDEVFKSHLNRHSGNDNAETSGGKDTSKKTEDHIPKEKMNAESQIGRSPLKEWKTNVPSSREIYESKIRIKRDIFRSDMQKRKFKEELNGTPRKRRRKGWKALLNDPNTSFVETHLSRKFHFDINNLCPHKQTKSGYKLDFTGEVLKAHGSLRKFNNYGEVISKYDNELAFVMTNNENEKQLRLIYDSLKENMRSMSDSNIQFTIYFRELDENPKPLIKEEPTLTDLEISLSSEEDDSDQNSIDLDSDLEALLELPGSKSKPIQPEKIKKEFDEKSTEKEDSDLIFDINAFDKVKFLQSKIKERNERMKELRRQKILSVSSKKVKKEVNGINPKLDRVRESENSGGVTNEITI